MMKRIMILSFIAAIVLTFCVYGSESYEKYEIHENVKAEYGECEEHIYPNGGAYEIIEPSCSRKGLKFRTCAVCAAIERIEIPKDPDAHSLVSTELTYEKKPTCTEGGSGFYVCLACNKAAEYVELEIDPEAHLKDGDFIVIEKETCRKNGTMAHKCQYCYEYFNYQPIPSDPFAHVVTDSSKWVVTLLPTCAQDGTVECYCDECGSVAMTRPVPATGNHIPSEEWYVVTEATCSSDGIMSRKCEVCQQPVDEIPIPADKDNHSYSAEYTVDVAATCISEGSQSRHCVYCDAKTDDTVIPVDSSAHSYNDEWIVTKEPTCSQTGLKHKVCQLCNKDSIPMMIQKTEHTYPDEYEVLSESADGASIQVKYICTECSFEFVTIITIGNNPGDGNIGADIDPEKKIYIIKPVANTVIRVDYEKMLISNVAREMKVEEFLHYFTNSNVFVIYNPSDRFISEEDNIGTGCRLNYETPDGNVTNYYVSVTGDMNSDGEVTAADARKILRVAAKLDKVDEVFSVAADVNLDGSISAADARKTLRVAANIEYFEETYEY